MNTLYNSDKLLQYEVLSKLTEYYGDAFYVLHKEQFVNNFNELKNVFQDYYPQFNIAYSYKTNYIPRLCQIINELGGLAEVVSDMEMQLALKIGVPPCNIIFNGPYKSPAAVEKLLLLGGVVNIDSIEEIDVLNKILTNNPQTVLNVGIRVNFAINDNVLSRFGFDIDTVEFKKALYFLTNTDGIHFTGFHVHIAARSLETWRPRAEGMLKLIQELNIKPERIDIGGGLFGKMSDDFKGQFTDYIPTYSEYAKEVATVFADFYSSVTNDEKPLLLIEPRSALVGDCMSIISRVKSVKTVQSQSIATLLCSCYNINVGTKNPPLTIVPCDSKNRKEYSNLNFAGFTCIESDYLYKNYSGKLAVGDYVIISNIGSYSIVFKPPFILPNFPVIAFDDSCEEGIDLIKRQETFSDVFQTYKF